MLRFPIPPPTLPHISLNLPHIPTHFLTSPPTSLSAAWPSCSERRFYDGHDRKLDGSTPTQASLLRTWIRWFTTIISAWWNLTNSKLKKSVAKFKRKTRKQGQLLSEFRFVQYIAPPSLSRDRKIKMKNHHHHTLTLHTFPHSSLYTFHTPPHLPSLSHTPTHFSTPIATPPYLSSHFPLRFTTRPHLSPHFLSHSEHIFSHLPHTLKKES